MHRPTTWRRHLARYAITYAAVALWLLAVLLASILGTP